MEESGVATGSDDNRCYKNLSRSYHLPSADGRKQACKTLFLKTYGISNGRLDRALQNQRANNGMIQPDKRGKHAKYKHSEEEITSVVDHISMFPRHVSHYTRSHQNSREYLASNLNLKIMYKL